MNGECVSVCAREGRGRVGQNRFADIYFVLFLLLAPTVSIFCVYSLPVQFVVTPYSTTPFLVFRFRELLEESEPSMETGGAVGDAIPLTFQCPITCQLLKDPVVAADGHTYERSALQTWLDLHQSSPMTGAPLDHTRLTPNHHLKAMISDWLVSTPAAAAVSMPASSASTVAGAADDSFTLQVDTGGGAPKLQVLGIRAVFLPSFVV